MLNNNNSWIPVTATVIEKTAEVTGCVTVSVVSDQELETFAPGQFYMVYIFGSGEIPISISGNPCDTTKLTFTVMGVGSVSNALCNLEIGDTLGLRGPFGTSWPLSSAEGKNVIFIAGGLGIAPLRPSIYLACKNRGLYNRLQLLYGSREPKTIVFHDEVKDWQTKGAIDVQLTVDNAGRDWDGKVGVVTKLLNDSQIEQENTVVFICGPEVMMRFASYALVDRGISTDRIYVSMERNMKCAMRLCGRCQFGQFFICDDGPVFPFNKVESLFKIREV